MPRRERETVAYLRNTFASLLITGPFSIILGFEGGLMALNDRLKLRRWSSAKREIPYISPARNAPYACLRASLTGYGLRAEASPL